MRVDEYFREYASSHRTPGNELTHVVGIPLIVWAVIRAESFVKLGPVDLGLVGIALVMVFYLTLSFRLALGAAAIALGMWWAGHALAIPLWAAGAAFVVGWAFQLVGHSVFEGVKPSFLKNLVHLLIGPIWLLNFVLRAAPSGLETKSNLARFRPSRANSS